MALAVILGFAALMPICALNSSTRLQAQGPASENMDVGIQNTVSIVNYADHGPAQSMTASPSVCRTEYLKLKKGILEEIEPPMENPDVNFR